MAMMAKQPIMGTWHVLLPQLTGRVAPSYPLTKRDEAANNNKSITAVRRTAGAVIAIAQ
jgi:hypothetical protein